MTRNLSIATVSSRNRFERPTDPRVFANAFQTATNDSLIVVCVVFVLFALAGYGIAELGLLN